MLDNLALHSREPTPNFSWAIESGYKERKARAYSLLEAFAQLNIVLALLSSALTRWIESYQYTKYFNKNFPAANDRCIKSSLFV